MFDVLSVLAVILLLSFLVETLTEFLCGDLFDHYAPAAKWTLKYVAVAVALGGAFLYRFDLLSLLGQFLEQPIPITPYGLAITGVAIGKGSNYLHDLIQRFFVKPAAG